MRKPAAPHRSWGFASSGAALRALVSLALALALPACGRVGPVHAKGPPSEVVYPRAYPYTPPARPTAPNAPAAAAPTGQGELPMERPGIVR